MGYFVAYRFTGADTKRLDVLMPAVCDALKKSGQEVYCTYFEEDEFQKHGYGIKEIFQHAFDKLDEFKGLFVLIDSFDKSEGMLIEVGYCLAKGYDVVVAKKTGVYTHLDKLAKSSFEYDDIEDLVKKIGENL